MKKLLLKCILLIGLCFFYAPAWSNETQNQVILPSYESPFKDIPLDTAIWQFATDIKGVHNKETDSPAVAFLWVPADAKKIRGVVIGQFNMAERPILESPTFRKYLASIGWGTIWINTGLFGVHFDHTIPENCEKIQSVFDSLAETTNLEYLKNIPFIGIGHSAMADFGYEIAAWKPERAVGAISYDGNTLCVGKQNNLYDHPFVTPTDLEKMKGIPLLHRDSEGNSGAYNRRTPLFRTRYPEVPFTILADPSSTHFGFPEDTCDFLGSWVVEADKARNPNGGLPLVKVDVNKGWYVDFWRYDSEPLAKYAPVKEYTRDDGNWVFSENQAKRMQEHVTRQNNKKHCIGAFSQNEVIIPDVGGHVGFNLKFSPENDGQRFTLKGVFLDTAAKGRQTEWAKKEIGDTLEFPNEDIPIRKICGPVEILPNGYAAVRFDRYGINKSRRANSICVLLDYSGNKEFRRSEIPAEVRVPMENKKGVSQKITFPAINEQKISAKSLKLQATSSLNLPVEYFVDYGPAYLLNGELFFSEIPSCVDLPIEIKVTAYQYGSSAIPQIQSAIPVSKSFKLIK